jgi:hypothetical protein
VSEAVQIVPTLTILEDEGEFTVRVGNQANAAGLAQALVPVISKLGGARKLTLITPTDIKSFKFNGVNGNAPLTPAASALGVSPSRPRSVIADQGAPPSAEDATAEFEEFVKQEREAERVAREIETTNQANPRLPVEEEAASARLKRGRLAKAQVEPAGASCGRCQGAGVLPGGGSCPVCRGKGVIAKWGGRKR